MLPRVRPGRAVQQFEFQHIVGVEFVEQFREFDFGVEFVAQFVQQPKLKLIQQFVESDEYCIIVVKFDAGEHVEQFAEQSVEPKFVEPKFVVEFDRGEQREFVECEHVQ